MLLRFGDVHRVAQSHEGDSAGAHAVSGNRRRSWNVTVVRRNRWNLCPWLRLVARNSSSNGVPAEKDSVNENQARAINCSLSRPSRNQSLTGRAKKLPTNLDSLTVMLSAMSNTDAQ
ncbi:uncharacterized protein LOC107271306 [Cephus cinctus]|uniref:Uncharacterized protein LOC107271306 n=1 Tax=Cephus cinctus TaxID=211228 RepID=A0AAJ7RPH0_CEPCN|nr:uncharacterized protein LOC107271306 [Cephus cinctus]